MLDTVTIAYICTQYLCGEISLQVVNTVYREDNRVNALEEICTSGDFFSFLIRWQRRLSVHGYGDKPFPCDRSFWNQSYSVQAVKSYGPVAEVAKRMAVIQGRHDSVRHYQAPTISSVIFKYRYAWTTWSCI